MMFVISETWKTAYPGASVGVLALHGVANPESHAVLEEHKRELEVELRARFAGYDRAALKALPTLQAYSAYYKRFKKTYHVQQQLESVVLKGRSIPRVAALVEAMFMAELKNQLLTAGHDLDLLALPAGIYVAEGSERYVGLGGQEQQLKTGDMFIADAQGVMSSIIYGPDLRTKIRPETRRAIFTVYAPPGIEAEAVRQHLQDIQANVRLVAPEAEPELLEVYSAG
jgi:DNA/RNA-binding domain of Phe-tRNA-synthetase-like protein